MAHELTTTNGQIEFAYRETDGLPWHGLGQPMADAATIDEWRVAAGMDWRIKCSKVRYVTGPDQPYPRLLEMPEQHVLFRSDTHAALGIVSDKYKMVQPHEVLEFFRDIVKAGGLELSAAGTIHGGRRFWATAKMGEYSTSVKDKIGGYLLISTSADGSLSTEVRRTTIRTVCQNTLNMALKDAPAAVRITHRSEFDIKKVQAFMGFNQDAWSQFRANIEKLANKQLLVDEAEALTLAIIGGDEIKVRESKGFNQIMGLFKGQGMGADFDGVYGTAFGLLNGVTEYVDHWARARSAENRFVSSQWGQGADLKDRALAELLTVAGAA
jgi:phage/plasmid-like protein (TIGR03299 family)